MPVYAIVDIRTNSIVQLSQQLPQEIINRWSILKNKFPDQPMQSHVEKAIQYINNSQNYQYVPISFEIMPYYTLHVTKNEQNEYVVTYVDTRPSPEPEPIVEESTPFVE